MSYVQISGITVGGVTLPTPKNSGITLSENKVWSANTGRTQSGQMTGTLIAVKHKIEIEWGVLTFAQYAVIQSALSSTTAWLTVTYVDAAGASVTYTMYAGDVSCKQFSWADGMQYVIEAKADLIER